MNPSYTAPQPEVEKPAVDRPRYSVLLAPFQPATRIELETKINTNIECYLDVRNASAKTLNVRENIFLKYFNSFLCRIVYYIQVTV